MQAQEELTIYPRLKDKVVLITGASAGIGAAAARHFAACGSHLILGARRVERLEALKEELAQKHGVKVHITALDVCSEESVATALKNIPEDLSGVDILVNNAGLALGKELTHLTPMEDVETMFNTNVYGVMRLIRGILPSMLERNSGHVINVSSVAGTQAYRGGSIYCATKHAVQAISDSLRKEVVNTRLRVTTISPGLVETEFSVVRHKGDTAMAAATYKGLVPLVGADIADNIVYVASRPEHVQVADVLVFANTQASAEIVHRDA
ncbi:Serine 3-dehydrogenase (NADP+) [Balamuthia mandrillaris]